MVDFVCPRCNSKHHKKRGKEWSGGRRVQKFQCLDCGKITMATVLSKGSR